jgi:exodeoxyribonuclease-1
MYGSERGGIAIVWPLAPHPTNKNELIVWDLSQDPSELFTLDAPTIRQRLYTRADELPEGLTRLPLKTIHLNKSPVVIGNLKVLTAERAQHWGIDVERCLAHAEIAARQGASMAGIWPDVYARPAAGAAADGTGPAVTDVDEDLYGGFLSNDDRRTLERLRALRPDELADRLADKRPAFQDDRLDELVFRWRARNFPATLDESGQARWEALRQARLIEGAGGVQTLEQFHERIDTLGESLADDDERGQDILGALYDYAEQIAP